MLDIRFVRENPEIVKENIKKKFQDSKLPLVDEVIALDEEKREAQKKADELRSNRNKISKEIGNLMAQGKKEEGSSSAFFYASLFSSSSAITSSTKGSLLS